MRPADEQAYGLLSASVASAPNGIAGGSDAADPGRRVHPMHDAAPPEEGREPDDDDGSDPMPHLPRRLTVQLRGVFAAFRKRYTRNPLTLRFHDRRMEREFEATMNKGSALMNSLLMLLGSGQLGFVLVWQALTWGTKSAKFWQVFPYQIAGLVFALVTGIGVYLVPAPRKRQRLVWSFLYGAIVILLFVVMDTVEHVNWQPTDDSPVEVFVSGNLMVLLFVYASTLQIPIVNSAIGITIALCSHIAAYATFVPQSLLRGYIPSITIYFTSCIVGVAGGWLRERNARERVLMEKFTKTEVVASLAEGLAAMRSVDVGLGTGDCAKSDDGALKENPEGLAWWDRLGMRLGLGKRRRNAVAPEGSSSEKRSWSLVGFVRHKILLTFRDPALEKAFAAHFNHQHAHTLFRIEMVFIAVSTVIHALIDFTTYHGFLISDLDFVLWLAITGAVTSFSFLLSFLGAVRRRPLLFQLICFSANMVVLQTVLVLYATNRYKHERNVYAPIAVEIILASAGESGMRLPFFYAFAGVVSASSAVKVAIGWTNLRELVDVVFPCLVGILYGTLSEREVRWWYIVRQRALAKVHQVRPDDASE